MSDGSDDDKVGYRRPPRSTRWQKGQTGNPAGRPKRKTDPIVHYLLKALKAPVKIKDGNAELTVTAREAIVRLRLQAATAGDPNAWNDLLLLQREEMRDSRSKAETFVLKIVRARDGRPYYGDDDETAPDERPSTPRTLHENEKKT